MAPPSLVVLVTVPSRPAGARIAKMLVDQHLAACVNLVPGIRSYFWWEGKRDQAKELLLIIKTRRALLQRLIQAVRRIHPYTLPEIIALPIRGGFKKYLDWVAESTTS